MCSCWTHQSESFLIDFGYWIITWRNNCCTWSTNNLLTFPPVISHCLRHAKTWAHVILWTHVKSIASNMKIEFKIGYKHFLYMWAQSCYSPINVSIASSMKIEFKRKILVLYLWSSYFLDTGKNNPNSSSWFHLGKDMTEEIVSEPGDPFHKNGQQVHMQRQYMKNNGIKTKILFQLNKS